jgi:hypothetical protein
MDYPKYEGNYLGIVVQNNDPERRGRVKVFVPHISSTVYNKWVENDNDLSFKFLGKNIESDLSSIIDDLRNVLPWAALALPIAGETASGRYNEAHQSATTSDTSRPGELFGSNDNAGEISSNQDGIGEKPGAIFDQNAYELADAFNNPAETNVNNVNKLSFNYKPETYSNRAKGAFAIPRVGAHVWVFFNNGDAMYPVVFAASYGDTDWGGIYDVDSDDRGQDYPGEYENYSEAQLNQKKSQVTGLPTTGQYTINEETYRNKYVINQKGGTIAFVNTDNRELLKLTHFSGSFKEFNNLATIELAANNDQKLVIGDSFTTIRGTRNEFAQQDYDCVIQGDHYRKVGDIGRVLLHEKWKNLLNDIADTKQLFDIQRTDALGAVLGSTNLIKLQSSKQMKSGLPRLCPICTAYDDQGNEIAQNNFFPPNKATFGWRADPHDVSKTKGDQAFGTRLIGGAAVKSTNGMAAGGRYARLCLFKTGQSQVLASDGSVLIGLPGQLPSIPGRDPVMCPACGKGVYTGTAPGQSPSSYGGFWTPDPQKIALPAAYADVLPKLAQIESTLGKGGSEIIEIEKNKIENIGLVMNDWGSVRVDMLGKMEPAFVEVFPGFTRTVSLPSPLIEQVHVDDLPGGTYSLNVANKYNLLVGAGGMNLKSYGVVNMSGTITNVAGEQVNIGSGLETNIDGGRRLNMVGDIVKLTTRQGPDGQVVVDGGLGVTGGTVIKGSLYVEGPIYFHELHSTAKVNRTNPMTTRASGYAKASPPTPMGTVMTSDTGHLVHLDSLESGVHIGENELNPVYMGYNDSNRVVGCAPSSEIGGKLLIGAIPPSTGLPITFNLAGLATALTNGDLTFATLLATSDYVPVVAVPNGTVPEVMMYGGGYDIKQVAIPDDFGIPSVTPIPVHIKSLCQISNSPTMLSKSISDITMSDALGLTKLKGKAPGPKYGQSDGAYIPGAGYGDELAQENLPLRGLPKLQREKLLEYESTKFATSLPMVAYGDGSNWDAIKVASSTSTYHSVPFEGEPTNADVRYLYRQNRDLPNCVEDGDATKHVNKPGTI